MYDGITVDRRVMGGVPCIEDTRIPVATVIGLLGHGRGFSEVLEEYPNLTKEGILASLRFAARAVNDHD